MFKSRAEKWAIKGLKEKIEPFKYAYNKDLSRLTTFINDYRPDFEKVRLEVETDVPSLKN